MKKNEPFNILVFFGVLASLFLVIFYGEQVADILTNASNDRNLLYIASYASAGLAILGSLFFGVFLSLKISGNRPAIIILGAAIVLLATLITNNQLHDNEFRTLWVFTSLGFYSFGTLIVLVSTRIRF